MLARRLQLHQQAMSTVTTSASSAKQHATQAAGRAQREVAPWVEKLARFGYAAKGFTYVLVGVLAFKAAIGYGGEVGDSRNALASLQGDSTFVTVLLWAVAIGISGYAIWQFFRAALDPEDEGDDAKGITKRILFAISGVIHAALAVWIYTALLSASGGGDNGDGTQGHVARVLDWGMMGRLLVAAVGAGIVIFGIQQLVKAWKVELSDQLSLDQMSERVRSTAVFVARFGLAARGLVFGLIGFFAINAAWQYDSSESGGIGETLEWISGFGAVVLGVIALGFAAYGIYMFVMARYRRINVAQ